jgi:hypothetical protein
MICDEQAASALLVHRQVTVFVSMFLTMRSVFVSSYIILNLMLWPGWVPADDGVCVDVPADHLHVGAGPARGEHGHPRQGSRLWYHHTGWLFISFLHFSNACYSPIFLLPFDITDLTKKTFRLTFLVVEFRILNCIDILGLLACVFVEESLESWHFHESEPELLFRGSGSYTLCIFLMAYVAMLLIQLTWIADPELDVMVELG